MPLAASPHVVITGAGGGFGRALALALAPRKARLVLADKDESTAFETARLASEAGAASAVAVACDVTRPSDFERLSAACPDRIDLLVNNAGVTSAGAIGELSLAAWRWTLDIDLFGVVYGCHVFVPRMRAQGFGHVLNIAAAAGFVSAPMMGAYNVAKAGVVSISETLAAELAGTGVGVTVACPTFFRSDIVDAGRFENEKAKDAARRLMSGGIDADRVARRVLRDVERGRLYSLPMADARWLWRLKRLAPATFTRIIGAWGRRQMR
ncbi:SDR family NAD(P)-dependent oxidoreductase [bacterium]|nr:SDR family NAD(P)-dependent oxidoreductase [bacterium]